MESRRIKQRKYLIGKGPGETEADEQALNSTRAGALITASGSAELAP
jgi:hypothetical protein